MIIYGAGMAGLLTAHIMRKYSPVIYESQPLLPNNHAALLRFRSSAVSISTGIEFSRVTVTKAVKLSNGKLTTDLDIAHNNMYSFKVTGKYTNRSILNLAPSERFIAPPDFIGQMASSCRIEFSSPMDRHAIPATGSNSTPIISTIPMPSLMDIFEWPKPTFEWRRIWTLTAYLKNTDLYQTIYYPSPLALPYRASITGRTLIIESMNCIESPEIFSPLVRSVMEDFGIDIANLLPSAEVRSQPYGKLLPLVEDTERRRFILAMTDRYRIYSVGRFATWRQLLMDDVVQDVQRISGWIEDRSEYSRRKAR